MGNVLRWLVTLLPILIKVAKEIEQLINDDSTPVNENDLQ